jgi:bifunctional non-homologous end joining protein LigD
VHELIYVTQKHAARSLHYDFRLELGGVLLSWAVPKGPSLDPKIKRLAMHVGDHALDHASFEGTTQGGGVVMIWDRGTWEPEGDPKARYEKGRLVFTLHGEKLKGRWHLVRTGTDKRWLLFKSRDEEANRPIDYERSVVSGRTMDEIAEG